MAVDISDSDRKIWKSAAYQGGAQRAALFRFGLSNI